ncbi:MAG: hypothetical protein AAF721_21055 [Myxococcota bacterium]
MFKPLAAAQARPMTEYVFAVAGATGAWFIAAAILFFNKPVDTLYRSEESHPAVRNLPQNPGTIGKILGAVAVQCALWAGVYQLVDEALPGGVIGKGLTFGLIVIALKVVPRDVDRVLLTTYPSRRMTVEFIVGSICAFVVGIVFAAIF